MISNFVQKQLQPIEPRLHAMTDIAEPMETAAPDPTPADTPTPVADAAEEAGEAPPVGKACAEGAAVPAVDVAAAATAPDAAKKRPALAAPGDKVCPVSEAP